MMGLRLCDIDGGCDEGRKLFQRESPMMGLRLLVLKALLGLPFLFQRESPMMGLRLRDDGARRGRPRPVSARKPNDGIATMSNMGLLLSALEGFQRESPMMGLRQGGRSRGGELRILFQRESPMMGLRLHDGAPQERRLARSKRSPIVGLRHHGTDRDAGGVRRSSQKAR